MDRSDLESAQHAFGLLVDRLEGEDWARPTPCPEWDVAALVRHVVVGERAFTISLSGSPYDLAALTAEVSTVAAAELPDAYGRAAEALRAALRASDTSALHPTGLGPMPAHAIAELRTIEGLVHGWDLGRATGGDVDVDAAVAERALDDARALMARLPEGRTPFGPSRPVPAAAPALDRLAALLGRSPG